MTDSKNPSALDRWIAPIPYGLRTITRKCLGLDRLDNMRLRLRAAGESRGFLEAAADALGVSGIPFENTLAEIPATGPVVVAANHPHGILDGLVLSVLMRRIRPDVKILANSLLGTIPELRQYLICVDPYGGKEARTSNRAPLREALRWLREGGLLLVFPAGDVASLRPGKLAITESAWSPNAARLAILTDAQIVPAFIEGRNSLLFHVLGLLHPRVRTALLPRELLNKQNQRVRVVFGKPISKWCGVGTREAEAHTRYARLRMNLLGRSIRLITDDDGEQKATGDGRAAPIADEEDRLKLRQQADALDEFALVRAGAFRVLCFRAVQASALLREVGRAREIAFREVGEGSGLSLDLDEFDEHYLHLVLWDDERGQVAGAYRLGLTDRILPIFGVRGLYTRTLFRYGRRLLHEFGPAIELGRSFVAAEYQRSYSPLLLLWKAIAHFVLRHPQYRVLFGAVSISAEYDSMTRRLLMSFLRHHHFDDRRARLVHARRLPRFGQFGSGDPEAFSEIVDSIDDVDRVVREIESKGRGIPVLVRQYLQLNARLLGFNIDPKFGNALDGLFYVDLTQVDPRILARYMGTSEAAHFLSLHGPRDVDAAQCPRRVDPDIRESTHRRKEIRGQSAIGQTFRVR